MLEECLVVLLWLMFICCNQYLRLETLVSLSTKLKSGFQMGLPPHCVLGVFCKYTQFSTTIIFSVIKSVYDHQGSVLCTKGT